MKQQCCGHKRYLFKLRFTKFYSSLNIWLNTVIISEVEYSSKNELFHLLIWMSFFLNRLNFPTFQAEN